MNKWKINLKRVTLTALVVVLMVIGMKFSAIASEKSEYPINASVGEVVDSGDCGENVTWTLTGEQETGYTLTISGTGDMDDYGRYGTRPWQSYQNYITTVIIENGVTGIGSGAFGFCKNINFVTIPNSVTVIGASAFGQCFKLTTISIPNGVTTIGGSAFDYTGLTSVTIPSTVTEWDGAFSNCDKLTTVIIEAGVKTIGHETFYGCDALASVTIPSSVEIIEHEAFSDCDSLTSVTIPNGVKEIWNGAFSYCPLTSVSISNSVWYIAFEAFSHCSLTSVSIPNSVSLMSKDAFKGCPLETVSMPCNLSLTEGEDCVITPNHRSELYYQTNENVDTISYKCDSCSGETVKLTIPADTTYTGGAIEAGYTGQIKNVTPVISYTGEGLVAGKPVNVGEYTAILTIEDNGTYSVSRTFNIKPFDISYDTVAVNGTYTYTGSEIIPDVTVMVDGTELTQEDYIIFATNNISAGEASLTITGKGNYKGKLDCTFTINKATCAIDDINKNYVYVKEYTDSIDLTELFPSDCGTVTCQNLTTAGDVTYITEPSVTNGMLSYKVASGDVGDAGTITMVVKSQNFEDVTIIVNISLIDQFPVSVKDGEEVSLNNNTLIFGEKLSKLTFKTVTFVDELGNAVEGNLAWKDASMIFSAGSTNVTWIFTPNNNEYKAVEGRLTITVNKAKNAPNMMSDTMNISNQYNKIGDIPLPEGWEWLATDKEIALKENATVTATAVYTGINKGNYENEAVLIRVTKNASVNGNITDTNTGNWTIQTWFTLLLVSGAGVVFVNLKSKRALRKVN